MNKRRIALIGKSGSGKTEIAKYLSTCYNFKICNTGQRCREIALEFFNTESKDILQKITDAFNSIEKGIWLKIALKDGCLFNQDIVIDSLRFIEDYNYAKSQGYEIWKIKSSQEIRLSRLSARGQGFKIENDHHSSETELQNIITDKVIENYTNDLKSLQTTIKEIMQDD